MSHLSRILAALSLTLGAAACTASEAAPPPSAAQNACVAMLTRARTCSDPWVPAIVDTRAKLDVPAGIAAQVKADRAGVIAKARQEWQSDSTDAAIAGTCQRIAADPQPPEVVQQVQACAAKIECGAFVACATPIFEAKLRGMAKK